MKPYQLASALLQHLQLTVQKAYGLKLTHTDIVIETPKQGQGDFATTLVFSLAKRLKQSPKNIGEHLVAACNQTPSVFNAHFAMPGFMNFTVRPGIWQSIIDCVVEDDEDFFSPNVGLGKSVYLEYISANPTGPLHVGHARCAALGSFLANVMTQTRYQVKQEYLINDQGLQIQTLALSVWLRHIGQSQPVTFPKKAYQGNYIQDIASDLLVEKGMLPERTFAKECKETRDIEHLLRHHSDPSYLHRLNALQTNEQDTDTLWLEACRLWYESSFDQPLRLTFEKACTESILSDIQHDCKAFNVSIANWFSERVLHEQGKLEACMEKLKAHTYRKDGALWFVSSTMGDHKDRVLQRSNGQFTYFAADIAYHLHKIEQQPDIMIDVFGADHHGYVARLTAAISCLATRPIDFSILIYQFVSLFKNKEPFQMSTRSGTYVTLNDLSREIGTGPARYFLLSKRPDMHINFDLEEAKNASMDNPLYRIHYAHARCHSILKKHSVSKKPSSFQGLNQPHELSLVKTMTQYPNLLRKCVDERSAHSLCQFLFDLANQLHSYYAHTKIVQQDLEKDAQRLYLISSCQKILYKGLALLGIEALDRM